MPHFADGVVRFQTHVFPAKKALFERLSRGQSPEALFITCSDSRIDAAMLTQSTPGSLFICRNAGNIVPPPQAEAGGMTASIEYAVTVLKVPHIVVCVHYGCGAMQGLTTPENLDELPFVRDWLRHAQAARERVDAMAPGADEATRMKLLVERNVVLQLENLRGHPSVARRLIRRDIELHGWVYDIKSGAVLAYDEATDAFQTVGDFYGASHAPACSCAS